MSALACLAGLIIWLALGVYVFRSRGERPTEADHVSDFIQYQREFNRRWTPFVKTPRKENATASHQ